MKITKNIKLQKYSANWDNSSQFNHPLGYTVHSGKKYKTEDIFVPNGFGCEFDNMKPVGSPVECKITLEWKPKGTPSGYWGRGSLYDELLITSPTPLTFSFDNGRVHNKTQHGFLIGKLGTRSELENIFNIKLP